MLCPAAALARGKAPIISGTMGPGVMGHKMRDGDMRRPDPCHPILFCHRARLRPLPTEASWVTQGHLQEAGLSCPATRLHCLCLSC